MKTLKADNLSIAQRPAASLQILNIKKPLWVLLFVFASTLYPLPSAFSPAFAAGPRNKNARRISPLSDSLRKVGKTPDRAAREAFRKFVSKTGNSPWRVRYSPKTALPEAVVGGKTGKYPGGPQAAALAFLNDNKDLFKVDVSQLKPAFSRTFLGVTHLQYSQFYNSIPVEFAYVRVHVTASGEVTGCQSKFEPDINIAVLPSIPADYAAGIASGDSGFKARAHKPELVIFPDADAGGALKLAWKLKVRAADAASGVWIYYVDASNGGILFKYNDLRYVCSDNTKSTGTVSGTVYDISPWPVGVSNNAPYWTKPVLRPITDQYVWIGSYLDKTITRPLNATSAEYCGDLIGKTGKAFASLKGPYFAVTNFRGQSAHFDNGGGVWKESPVSKQSPHPYENSYTYPPYTVTIPDTWTADGDTFAKAMPRFAASVSDPFQVGAMDIEGTITDWDVLTIKNAAGNIAGNYTGKRTKPFYGAAVESPEYSVNLKTDETGVYNGFSIDSSRYLVLTDNPPGENNLTGSIVWSTTTAGINMDTSAGVENALDEVNAFYHLTKARDYFGTVNKDPNNGGAAAADLLKQVPVMVHAHGTADNLCAPGSAGGGDCVGGMMNAWYDAEGDNLVFGDGPMDEYGNYRSFALDGTIVRHEYTHLAVNRIYPVINFGEFGAISEALADYFSLASFRAGGADLDIIGNFLGSGYRDLSGGAGIKKMPGDWTGEVHDDSLILSQALWRLKNSTPTTTTDLGNFSASIYFPNMPRSDVFVYTALFYFPDNFANFYDAMIEACKQLPGSGCDAAMQNKITLAFSSHAIAGIQAGGDAFEGNNGPEWATDISTLSSLSATIAPVGDLDYYSIPLAAGNFTARLDLPASSAYLYQAYSLFLFDNLRNYITQYEPVIYGGGACRDTGPCYTEAAGVTLNYNVAAAGRYYLVVAGSLNQWGGNSQASSQVPYRLNLSYTPKGSANAAIAAAVYDNDTISFTVPYLKAAMELHPSSTTPDIPPGVETVFQYAQLRDHNYVPLALARTDTGSYLEVDLSSLRYDDKVDNREVLKGSVRLKPGFASRYPGVGTVYLEIFGRNHMGRVMSMGVSNAINLSTNKSAATAYNNIITGAGSRAIIKYDVLTAGTLSIKIYTAAGTLVKTVYDGPVPAGKGTVDWDGTNSKGSKAASGIYFLKVSGAGLNTVDKIAVVR
ncbi:MAG: hypothetical protein HY796_01440 [Elusimicrobia bacterium]|nr:hypothetical protein [Elusimicrobiota bacterium]